MLAGLSKEETLALFGGYYRDVVATPEGDDHPNIRNFMKSGWDGVTAWSKCPLGTAQLGSCASSGRAWQLWLARRSQGRDQPTRCPATASGARASHLQSRRFHCV